jgi:Icc-related predicted phosphoesterase
MIGAELGTGSHEDPMKILIGSDYHCKPHLLQQALDLIPEVDGYINCGDFCAWAGVQRSSRTSNHTLKIGQEIELLQNFLAKVDHLGKPWLFLPGNHDPSAAVLDPLAGSCGRMATASALITWQGLQVLLIPWTPPCGWNWTLTSTHLQELLQTYTSMTVDLIISHGPPRGILDEGGKWYHSNTPTLRPLVDALQPRYFFCGHMHWDGGKVETHGSTVFVNAALHNLVIEIE